LLGVIVSTSAGVEPGVFAAQGKGHIGVSLPFHADAHIGGEVGGACAVGDFKCGIAVEADCIGQAVGGAEACSPGARSWLGGVAAVVKVKVKVAKSVGRQVTAPVTPKVLSLLRLASLKSRQR
jgi:hypothetical protein